MEKSGLRPSSAREITFLISVIAGPFGLKNSEGSWED
jgi:hypothetical protein